MNGPNPAVLTCFAVSLAAAVALMIRTRNIAWLPAYVGLIMFSAYEVWQVWGQEFIYVDDDRDIPAWLYLTMDLCLIGLAIGSGGLVVVTLRWAYSKIASPNTIEPVRRRFDAPRPYMPVSKVPSAFVGSA